MNERQQIADYLVEFLQEGAFNAPYGILSGDQKDKKGKTYKSVTFGIARTLDAEIRIYGARFILLRHNQGSLEKFNDVFEVEKFIKTTWDYCFKTVSNRDDEMIDF